MDLKQGAIALAWTKDERGFNEKKRPVVVITSDDDLTAGAEPVGVAITGSIPDPSDGYVKLPWANGRHRLTGLKKPSAAKPAWLVPFQADGAEVIGKVSKFHLLEILKLMPVDGEG